MNEEQKDVDLWTIESRLYSALDSMCMRGERQLKMISIPIGGTFVMDMTITSTGSIPLKLQEVLHSENVDCSIQLRNDSVPWLRIDNQGNCVTIHEHLESGTRTFQDHISLSGAVTLSDLVNYAFTRVEEVIKWKSPETKILPGSNFVGFC